MTPGKPRDDAPPELVPLSDEPTPNHDADGLEMQAYLEDIARGD